MEEGGRRGHRFTCAALGCNAKPIMRWLDTKDNKSTKALRNHIQSCRKWGEGALEAMEGLCTSVDDARKALKHRRPDGTFIQSTITQSFARAGKGKVTYSVRQHTREETRVEIVRWVAESLRPFSIIEDRGFNSLMKTG